MDISSAIFECSAPDLASCPDEALPEFAFIGRSNVGKSSLLNVLAGQAGLARVSPTPGFTKMINLFIINRTWRLVDLPGYGFAAGSRKETAKFNQAVLRYLQQRPNLRCVFTLIEAALPPQEVDLKFLAWLTQHAVPYVLVFTKTDKVPPRVVEANIAAFMQRIAPYFEKPPVAFKCSAKTGNGRTELLRVIAELLAAAPPEAEPAAPPKPAPFRTVAQLARANRKRRPDLNRPW